MAEDLILLLHDPKQPGNERLNVAIIIPRDASDNLVRKRLWRAWTTYQSERLHAETVNADG